MTPKTISVNRAPVLTLWGSVVAERLGFDEREALSLGRALAGLTAQSKGRRLGIYKPHEEGVEKARAKKRGEQFWIELCGRPLPAKMTADGIRAVQGSQVIDPGSAQRYLESKFGENLAAARSAMEKLARSYPPRELAERGFELYEQFRPDVPPGEKGWGAKGQLDLAAIKTLARRL